MELQWPLILFTSLVAWSSGIFGTQALYAFGGKLKKTQLPALAASLVVLVISGLAVFTHLQHWERIFNGFGNPTSGITHEMVAIVVFVLCVIVYFAFLRRNDGAIPQWLCVVAIVVSVVMTVVCGKSYMMEARPSWDSLVWLLCLVGTGCAAGVGTVLVIAQVMGEEAEKAGLFALVASVVNAVAMVLSLAFVGMVGSSYVEYEFYYDLTHPMKDITATSFNPLAGDFAAVTIVGVLIVGVVVPLVAAFMGKKSNNWKVWGAVLAVAAVIGAICIRVVFYAYGLSIFMFY